MGWQRRVPTASMGRLRPAHSPAAPSPGQQPQPAEPQPERGWTCGSHPREVKVPGLGTLLSQVPAGYPSFSSTSSGLQSLLIMSHYEEASPPDICWAINNV